MDVTRIRSASVISPVTGDPVSDWEAAEHETIPGWLFDPGGSYIAASGDRKPIVSTPTLYRAGLDFPDVTERDRLEVAGTVYDLDGSPALWQGLASPGGIVIRLKKVSG